MQLGGNAKAVSFFRHHNCSTTDTQQKYNSRAAQLYREKLHQAAAQAMRLHGNKLHIDTGTTEEEEVEKEEDDFFVEQEKTSTEHSADNSIASTPILTHRNGVVENTADGVPNVEQALATSPTSAQLKAAPRKPTIGGRKPIAKKPGLGGKKGGLGAQKATKSFAEVEREAEMADSIASVRKEESLAMAKKSEEDEGVAMASMRLAYQDLSVQQQKQDKMMAKLEPTKAAQVERLGMGFGGFGGGAKSHSLVSDMGVITQEEPSNARKPSFQTSTKEKFFDDFEIVDHESDKSETPWRTSRVDEICEPSRSSNDKSAWEKDLNENMKTSSKPASSAWDNDFESNSYSSRPSSNRTSASATSAPSGDDAVKKFGNAKAISSDQFFDGAADNGRDANMTRFQGSSSISSAEYFGRDEGMSRSSSNYSTNLNAPDMDDVKESVRQGVSKVAGRLSNMASGVMNQIQRVKQGNA